MEWVIAALLAAGAGTGGLVGLRRLTARRRGRREGDEELLAAQAMADEDTTLLGEQLQRIGAPAGAMDEATRQDYQSALDAYESAKRAVPRLRSADAVSTVVDTLSTGRYALACVEARLAGRPVPELRVPCFFNPQHGPSVRDVRWTSAVRGTRTVPACSQDAARVARGESPPVRQIRVGSTWAPYWEAGAAFLPYGENYFSAGIVESGYHQHGTDSGGIGYGGL
jgi:hypothetical protein